MKRWKRAKEEAEREGSIPKYEYVNHVRDMGLLPFGSQAKCVKCGCVNIQRRYVARDIRTITPWGIGGLSQRGEETITIPSYIDPEHMKCSCSECGFSWGEKVLNSEQCDYCREMLEVVEGACGKCGAPAL